MEYVLAKEPFQGGGGVFESGIRLDGRVPGKVEDCFRSKEISNISLELRFEGVIC